MTTKPLDCIDRCQSAEDMQYLIQEEMQMFYELLRKVVESKSLVNNDNPDYNLHNEIKEVLNKFEQDYE